MAVQFPAHISLALSFLLTGFLRKYHYRKYGSSPHATAAFFARHSSLLTFTSIHFSAFHHLHFIYRNKADFSWRIRIVAPHISHVLYESEYSIIKERIGQTPSDLLDKTHDLISHKSTQGKLLLLTPCVLSVNDEITSQCAKSFIKSSHHFHHSILL